MGLDFKPVVFEAHSGGWSPTAQDVIKTIAKNQFSRGVWCQEGPLNRIAERLSCTLMKYAAHAVLRRETPLAMHSNIPLDLNPGSPDDDDDMDPEEGEWSDDDMDVEST